jgi:hypothetical protein
MHKLQAEIYFSLRNFLIKFFFGYRPFVQFQFFKTLNLFILSNFIKSKTAKTFLLDKVKK